MERKGARRQVSFPDTLTRILMVCADVEAALRRYNQEGITNWAVIMERLQAESPPIVVKYFTSRSHRASQC